MTNTENLMPEMSEKADLVIKSLVLAKREMGSSVKKDSTNPFHKSRYASLAAHLELCEETLDKHGLILLHTGNGSHDKPLLIATLYHVESGQWIKSYLPLPNPKADSQGLGASITYMRRYSINSLLALTAEDDDGETAAGRGKAQKKQEQPKRTYHNDAKKLPISDEYLGNSSEKEVALNQEQIDTLAFYLPRLTQKCKYNFFNFFGIKDETELHKIPADKYKGTINSFELNIEAQKVSV